MNCRSVPTAYAAFDAHSSPFGLEYFDESNGAQLKGSFLVALHGSTKRSLNRGYRVVRIPGTAAHSIVPEDFITGFLQRGAVHGRPVDVLSLGIDTFLLTDDHAGVVYYVYRRRDAPTTN
jgi:glucose/arabinose dehydrogenase